MLHFPNNVDLEKMQEFIKPTNSDHGFDSYQHGINMRITNRDNFELTERVLDQDTNNIDFELFWSGYYYGIESVVDQCRTQQ